MCRFAVYLGAPARLSALVTEPTNSIIHQSYHSHLRAEPLNGDGFGVAWYPADGNENPALFRSTSPAWSNHNLRELARVTDTRCMLAHVRAATPGLPVNDLNCHPFAHAHLTFMHNGELGGFHALRRGLLRTLSDAAFDAIQGSTDSEHIFAVFLDELDALPADVHPTERLTRALEAAIARVEALRLRVAPDAPTRLNLVVADGASTVVSRYASPGVEPNSLYYAAGRMYVCDRGLCHMETESCPGDAVIIASEPLDDGDEWTAVPPGELLAVTPHLEVSTRPLGLPDVDPSTAPV